MSILFKDIFEKIPSSNPVLSPEIYEKVLNEFLRSGSYDIFKYLIKKWPCDIYGLDCVTQAIATASNKRKTRILDECIALM